VARLFLLLKTAGLLFQLFEYCDSWMGIGENLLGQNFTLYGSNVNLTLGWSKPKTWWLMGNFQILLWILFGLLSFFEVVFLCTSYNTLVMQHIINVARAIFWQDDGLVSNLINSEMFKFPLLSLQIWFILTNIILIWWLTLRFLMQ